MRKWDDWNREDWDKIQNKYLPDVGQGKTLLTQAVTCVCKLVYRYFNDGDFYQTTFVFESYTNLTSYANWLYEHIEETRKILNSIYSINSEQEYVDILWKLSEIIFSESFVSKYESSELKGDVYKCDGPFTFIEPEEDSIDEIYEDEEEW